MKNYSALIWALTFTVCVSVICSFVDKRKIDGQQRQIDHICRIMPQLVVDSKTLNKDQSKVFPDVKNYRNLDPGEYCLHFIDYHNKEALIYSWREQKFFVIGTLPEGVLENWYLHTDKHFPL